MAGAIDSRMLERKIGSEAASKLRAAFKSAIRASVNVRGASGRATVSAQYKNDRLDRLTFSAPHYIYKQHHGFEGTKKNGIMMRLQSTNVLNKAIESSQVLESLADSISDLRAEEVITSINFHRNGR